MVEKALRWEKQHRGATILMVEQNLSLAMKLADRLAIMKLGQIVLEQATNTAGIREELIRQLAP